MHKCQTAIYEHWITSFYSSFGLLLQWDDKTETNNSRKFVKVWNSNLQLLLALGMQHGSLFTLFNFHLSALNKTKKLLYYKRLESLVFKTKFSLSEPFNEKQVQSRIQSQPLVIRQDRDWLNLIGLDQTWLNMIKLEWTWLNLTDQDWT